MKLAVAVLVVLTTLVGSSIARAQPFEIEPEVSDLKNEVAKSCSQCQETVLNVMLGDQEHFEFSADQVSDAMDICKALKHCDELDGHGFHLHFHLG